MKRRVDLFGLALAFGLSVFILVVGGAAVLCRFLTVWDLLFLAGLGVVLIAAHPLRPASTPTQNTFAHGAARAAHENETLRAAAGNRGSDLDQQTFRE